MALPTHIQVALRMLPHLIDCAKTGRRTNHAELGNLIGAETRMFSRPLAWIRDEICVKHNLPPLTAIVDNKGKDVLANSFSPSQFTALNAKEYEALQAAARKKVYDYQRWDFALQGLKEMFMLV